MNKLIELDLATNPVYVANQRKLFYRCTFNPTQETVRAYIDRLQSYANTIAGSNTPISKDDIRQKLLGSVPKADPIWVSVRNNMLKDNDRLQGAIIQFL